MLLIRLHPKEYEKIYLHDHVDSRSESDPKQRSEADLKQERKKIDELRESKLIHLVNRNQNYFSDPNELLPYIDILVSDYSSIYHDFLLLDQPILFSLEDYQDFKREGFIYDYRNKIPGPEVHDMDDFLREAEIELDNQGRYRNERESLTDMIHKYVDSKSAERVWETINKI